ncbi:two-component response regulator [Fulvivirga imtechensis AK7]|uniref:Two-component response regulator n=1 Tax=Fulvivirga imtechensis AK7 TaxID=1237149 RepID=L8JZE5_9BACT|nr:response regulator [Fulvivirga imtechensis]ELR73034.1 two-component response regulator [Fulvivirga imtechensis AK7]
MSQILNCFLVDDDPDDREIFALALHDINHSYKCTTAKNGVEALEKLSKDQAFLPDFIFLDLNMPKLSGKNCLKKIRENSRLLQVPVIIYSTSSYENDIEETRQLGATHYLVKPASISYLSELLFAIFDGQEMPFLLGFER